MTKTPPVHHQGALAVYSVSLSKPSQIRCAAHLSKVSFLQMVILVLPLGWLSDSTWRRAEQGAMAGWTSQ